MSLTEMLPPDLAMPTDDNGRQEWSVFCDYSTLIDRDLTKQILERPSATAFVERPGYDKHLLIFREQGAMDEAVAGAVLTLRGMTQLIHMMPQRVRIANPREGLRATFFDVSRTVLDNLRAEL